ncbi:MAG: tetratricopeptide repeat protein, partial [Thermomicrobiales bacterium]|nr:tetratricopeptide repeat protein [Thermomicrobiales bacterium]
ICRRLDGLPLAIELAAGRGRALSPADLLDRLGNRLHLLDRGPRDLPARQRTLRDTVAWSYDLLTHSECLLFHLLAVFSASSPLTALEELWSLWAPDHRDANVLDLLDSLAAKSLVTPLSTADDNTPRFALLETLRAYGIERLRADGRDDEAQRLHARWYLALAEASIPEMTGRHRAEWLDRLELDHPNFRAAMSWAIAARESEIALRFIDGLWRYWEPRGYLLEGYELGVQSLALLDEGVDPAIRARALYGVSIMPYRMGRFDDARRLAESCLALYRTIGDPDGIAHGLNACALVAFDQGDFGRAESAYLESLEIARSIGRIERTSICLINLGILYLEQNRLDEAWDTYHQALIINSRPDRSYDRAFTLNGLGLVAHRRGELAEAIEHFEAAIEIRRPERDSGGLAASLTNLALVHITRGEPIRAAELLQEALHIRWKRGEPRGVAEVLAGLARIALGQRQTETAASIAGAVQALTERGQRLPRHELDDLGRLHEALQRELGPVRFAELIAAGRAARLETIVERAATIAPTPGPEPAMPAIDTPLTPREIDVLRLIAVGKSDREIGEALGISRNTVIRHVANIFLKLEVNSRTMAAMYAHRHGLAPTEP